ncbi:type IV secretory system conjugative DNA transfer family protein [Enterococcus sp. BWM-S5]|uniref:Type IV secretory system conjugative DNA transfer family protein n=1 Tax=Enterococcus larvae TaxID=2794352 RepID=A0ABS4CIS0_9ENTE|nr:type IV secretory system conjugative DNA transfer family protein [Enterococcus larvae]MBP1046167.1 type IV secretory system conjugative DNA transfer family protein [Enterococcus larvae]
MKHKIDELVWHKMTWQRPFEFENVLGLVGHIATTENRKPIIFEVRAAGGKISFLLGTESTEFSKITKLFQAHGKIDFGPELKADTTKRKLVKVAKRLNMTRPILSLKTDNAEALARTTLATMAQVADGDEIVLQLVLASSIAPENLPKNLPDPSASWWHIVSGNVPTATGEIRSSVKNKVGSHRINTVVRLGAYSKEPIKAQSYVLSVLSALKMLESSGIKINIQPEEPKAISQPKTLWSYPLKLSVAEIANLMLLPTGEDDFQGVTPLHPKVLLPPKNYQNPTKNIRTFAETLNENPDDKRLLHLSAKNNLQHLHVCGPTGSGKSVVLENLILADCENGQGLVVIDPKFSLIESIVQRIPEHRLKDVVIWDLGSHKPLGINVLSYVDGKSPELVAETVLSSLRTLFPDFGIYTEELLTCGLLTLARNKEMTLLHLPLLFTNADFRHKLTSKLTDMYLKSFWAAFELQPEKERNQQLAPLLRRLNVLLMRESFRGVLGQTQPKFNLEDVFTKNKILLVPLNSGLVGNTVAELCASLLINSIWNIALRRAELPEEKRVPVMLYIDEFQNYVKRSGSDFGEILAMARGLGLAFICAHQYLDQLDKQLKESVLSNTKSKIFFQPSKTDAKVFADLAPELAEIDFTSLPQYQIYTSLNEKKIANVWLSGKTFPPKPSLRLPAEVFASSAETYGRDIDEIEKEYVDLLNQNKPQTDELNNEDLEINLGKKKRKA